MDEDLTWEETQAILTSFKLFADFGTLGLADVLTFARRKGWLEQMEIALANLHFDQSAVKKAMAVGDVPRGLRHPALTAEHYYIVSGLLYEDQVRWLDASVANKLSPLALKRSVEAGRLLTEVELQNLTGAGSGILNYHGILTSWQRWEKKVGGSEAILSWPAPVRRRWLEDVRGLRDLINRVEDSL